MEKKAHKQTHINAAKCFWQAWQDPSMDWHWMSISEWTKATQWEDSLFNELFWDNWITICKMMKQDSYQTLNTKINSKWMKDLHITSKIINNSEENLGQKLHVTEFGNDFLDKTPKM